MNAPFVRDFRRCSAVLVLLIGVLVLATGSQRAADPAPPKEAAGGATKDKDAVASTPTPPTYKGAVLSVAWSGDGNFLAAASEDKTARVWDPKTWTPASCQLSHGVTAQIVCVAFSPQVTQNADNTLNYHFLTGGDDKNAKEWKMVAKPGTTPADGNTSSLGLALSHSAAVRAAAYRSSDDKLVTGCADGTVRLWSPYPDPPVPNAPPKRSLSVCIKAHTNSVLAIAFSRDGKKFATGSADNTACVWDSSTGVMIGAPLTHCDPVTALVFRPDTSRFLLTASGTQARLWDTEASAKPDPADGQNCFQHTCKVLAVAFLPMNPTTKKYDTFYTASGTQSLAVRRYAISNSNVTQELRFLSFGPPPPPPVSGTPPTATPPKQSCIWVAAFDIDLTKISNDALMGGKMSPTQIAVGTSDPTRTTGSLDSLKIKDQVVPK